MRLKSRALSSALWVALGLAACGMAGADQPLLASASPTPSVTSDGARAATDLKAESRCSETELRKPIAVLVWTAAPTRGLEQRVDVTTRTDGFAAGNYRSSGSLGIDVTSLTWDSVEPGIVHQWRVVTVYSGVAIASEVASFKGAVCVADFQPSQSPLGTASPSPKSQAAPTSANPIPAGSPQSGASAPSTGAPSEPVALGGATPASDLRVDSASRDAFPLVVVFIAAAAIIGAALWLIVRRPA